MKEDRGIKRIIYGASAVVFACVFFFTFHGRTHRFERQQVQIVTFGDSMFGLVRDETSIPSQIGELLGKTVFNAAFGGTCVSRLDQEQRLDYAKDALSLVGLTRAVAADDFGVQQTVKVREVSTQHFEETVDQLEGIDFSAVELVLIQHGLNDYYTGVPIRNEEDPYDEYTFAGALRSSLESLRRANPEMRIVLITPVFSWYLSTHQTCEEYDGGGGVQEDYIRAEMEVAEELGIEVIDVYHGVYSHEKWEDWELYTEDGFHPNKDARGLLAGIIADYLK